MATRRGAGPRRLQQRVAPLFSAASVLQGNAVPDSSPRYRCSICPQGGHQSGVAARCLAARRGPIRDEVQASPVSIRDPRGSRELAIAAGNVHPRLLQHNCAPALQENLRRRLGLRAWRRARRPLAGRTVSAAGQNLGRGGVAKRRALEKRNESKELRHAANPGAFPLARVPQKTRAAGRPRASPPSRLTLARLARPPPPRSTG